MFGGCLDRFLGMRHGEKREKAESAVMAVRERKGSMKPAQQAMPQTRKV